MPDANGRFRGMAVPANAPWPPARELPEPYVPEDDSTEPCPDCGGEGLCFECGGEYEDPEDCGECSGDGVCGYCGGEGEV